MMGLRDVAKKLLSKKWIWQIVDSSLCLIVFFPSMLFYWRGIWDLFGVYIFPNDAPKCHWVTAGLGACSIVGYYALPLLSRLLGGGANGGPPSRRPVYIIVTRLYMYAFGVLAMAYWRGVWGLADYYLLPFGWKSGLIGLVVCHVILLALRSSRTTIFPPFVVTLDTRKDLLQPSTCFQTQVNWSQPKSIVKYTLDSLLTHYVIMTATIVSWRSSLNLLDIFMFPSDWFLSNWSCFVIGVAASVLLLALETPLNQLANHIQATQSNRWLSLIYEDTVYFFVFIVVSMIWRGGWNLNAMFIIADPKIGGWVNHAIGTVLLFSFQLFSYASVCGCAWDGQDERAGDAFYPTKYLRHFLPTGDNATATCTVTNREEEERGEGSEQLRPSNDIDATVSQSPEKSTESEIIINGGEVDQQMNGCHSNPAFVSDDDAGEENTVVKTDILEEED